MNFVKYSLNSGGSIHPLILPIQELQGPSLTNPSVYNDDGRILVNLRNINYTLYHAEKNKYENQWGPLVYIHPENDMHLRTWNYLCELDENLRISKYSKIDTIDFPDQELWEFVGLEDCRIVRWNQKLYVSGVRRDLDTTGIGRMELCEIQGIKQVSQFRIPTPVDKNSYCEKNWMPITDMPYHYVKWTNGTEVVKVNPETQTCEQVKLHTWKDLGCGDLRGGSQVIPFGKYRMCIVHETSFQNSEAGRKDGVYRHRFVLWDQDWNIVKISPEFFFMGAKIEFCCGMTEYQDDLLISFGVQDNAAYLLRVPQDSVNNLIGNVVF